MKLGKLILTLALLLSLGQISFSHAVEVACHDDKEIDFPHVIPCYREKLSTQPLNYSLREKETLPQLNVHKYQMTSQFWSPDSLVKPALWQHDVDIYIPDNPKPRYALLLVNNGINQGNDPARHRPPTDMSADALAAMARATRTVVISVSNIPNQPLSYGGDPTPLVEDASVARSWRLFMDSPALRKRMSLHVPMAVASSQAIRLAKQELAVWHIDKFIVTGLSKRGWSAWLTFISDPDVEAVVPFVIDLLDTRVALTHMYRSYGGNWPIAFHPYYQKGIDTTINTPAFTDLMQIEDPLHYLSTGYRSRFNKAKYIINASGDDFYVADNARFYYDKLPGEKALRVTPNTDHGGITQCAEQALVTFVNRFQAKRPLPTFTTTLKENSLTVNFSEKPVKIRRWTATNGVARDFRYACGVRYSASAVTAAGRVTVPLTRPQTGWQATFIEATFDDGFVATSRVYITPDDVYPNTAPPVSGAACATLPGRGLGGETP